ncbi:hypothetical protein ACTXT7_007011 [Hymenolepis weldensis]
MNRRRIEEIKLTCGQQSKTEETDKLLIGRGMSHILDIMEAINWTKIIWRITVADKIAEA